MGSVVPMRWVMAGVLAASSAGAGDDTFERYLASVRELRREFSYEQALEQARRARAYAREPREFAVLEAYEGILDAELDRDEASARAFLAALLRFPQLDLPERVSPKLKVAFANARVEAARRALAAPTALVPALRSEEATGGWRRRAWVPAVAGGALTGLAAALFSAAADQHRQLVGPGAPLSGVQADAIKGRGQLFQSLAAAALSTGLAGLGSAGLAYALGGADLSISVTTVKVTAAASLNF